MTKNKPRKNPPGRPQLPEEERKDQMTYIRLTEEEKARFFAAAAQRGLKFSDWARLILNRSAPAV